ncbi:MAG: phosphoenolpyruvate synthase [candidate division WOR-3 bacterium]|nr:phosphoenolpyruvate synthase [candidate division WOR-3 bacterium]MCX7757705.1 phosphoenolpyruvate synthase [candidate division WOR-3 bacterium]MDW7987441.1 phosphoenolpyruvate synthase [candidate division WOR-3 bacterium]
MRINSDWIKWFDAISLKDLSCVGGKNASLGEMYSQLSAYGIKVPLGFAITTQAYHYFLEANGLEEKIFSELNALKEKKRDIPSVGRYIRHRIRGAEFPTDLKEAIKEAYLTLSREVNEEEASVAVRSSATAEDLPDASFAGQQDTFLNIVGCEELIEAIIKCFASLFTDRAIAYRENHGFDHKKVAISVGVQKMVRSDLAGAGVMFTIDTESGFEKVVFISATLGLGETMVQGQINPDEYYVFKPLLKEALKSRKPFCPIIKRHLGSKERKMIFVTGENITTRLVDCRKDERELFVLTDDEICQLAKWGILIEEHYSKVRGVPTPVDVEWAKDGITNDIYIVQARPETIHSRKKTKIIKEYRLEEKSRVLVSGKSVGASIAVGRVCRLKTPEEQNRFDEGGILVTEMTDPNWVPIIRKASAIVTDSGGRTCHAAIVAREFGIPAIVGTGNATEVLNDGEFVTVSCVEGEVGKVYEGKLKYHVEEVEIDKVPKTKTKVMVNIGDPTQAFIVGQLPCDGVGLARLEFIINNFIGIHPMALVDFEHLPDYELKKLIRERLGIYESRPRDFFVEKLAEGIATIAAAFYPNDVIVRMSDFKTNEYAGLLGGKFYEPEEENPMLGFRGASRYYSQEYRRGFDLECQAIKKVREEIGLTNVIPMIPFLRTPDEGIKVLEVFKENGLERGKDGLKIYMMCEVPSNIIMAEEFANYFDGFSIGSNDLTQLILGLDRDSGKVAHLFDERNPAVKKMISELIKKVKPLGRKVGICGQAPSDYPEFVEFLVKEGIDSISVNPDSFFAVKKKVFETENLHEQ